MTAGVFEKELENILRYWMDYAVDANCGGFYGRINSHNQVDEHAPKGAVLNARILWSFSAAYLLTGKARYLEIAERSFTYLQQFFFDKKYGSVFWSVNSDGHPLDTKKQVYALAFAIYGLSEFYRASKNEEALTAAIAIYNDIENYSRDKHRGGYLEAFTRNWQQLPDFRLSKKDANEKKTLNTHLHILEAYTNLYRVWPDQQLKSRLLELVTLFFQHFIDPTTHHLNLFFDEEWNIKSSIISFGHDIEASWLLMEAAKLLEDDALLSKVTEMSILMVRACSEGLDDDGSMFYEYDADSHEMDTDKHWWVQAEAMVGFLNAWQVTGDRQFYEKARNVWAFIDGHIVDHRHGEWVWGVRKDNSIMEGEDKAGFWKCPYHNSRACMKGVEIGGWALE